MIRFGEDIGILHTGIDGAPGKGAIVIIESTLPGLQPIGFAYMPFTDGAGCITRLLEQLGNKQFRLRIPFAQRFIASSIYLLCHRFAGYGIDPDLLFFSSGSVTATDCNSGTRNSALNRRW